MATTCDWIVGSKAGLVTVKIHQLFVSISGPDRQRNEPIIIVFPGSGDTFDSWRQVEALVNPHTRILLYDRSGLGRSAPARTSSNATGAEHAAQLQAVLRTIDVRPPFVLVAQSYGGCVAREFLQLYNKDVSGLVLADTGTETQSRFHAQQYERQILGNRPLSVIRCQSLATARKAEAPDPTMTEEQRTAYVSMLETWEAEAEFGKKEQLRLSSNNRFVELHDCGHSVHRERPDIVAAEIAWVVDQLKLPQSHNNSLLRYYWHRTARRCRQIF